MTKIIPADWVEKEAAGPLTISKSKKTAMVSKAKELLTKPMEPGELADVLEQYYVTEKNEHYTSAQLNDIVAKVAEDLAPEVVVEGP